MSNLTEFNSSVETTKEWISELMETLRTDNEAKACRTLKVTLHTLRDQLQLAEVADLAAQLPQLIRGVYYEGWRPAGKQIRIKSKEQFLEKVIDGLKEPSQAHAEKVVRDVFTFLDRRVSGGEIRQVVMSLPKEIRDLWPQEAGGCCAARAH
jgi:uncharacterized protein (DUF2267 family)